MFAGDPEACAMFKVLAENQNRDNPALVRFELRKHGCFDSATAAKK